MKGMAGAVTDSKLLYDNEHDDVDDHEDFMKVRTRSNGSATTRKWTNSSHKTMLYADRPPLKEVAGAAKKKLSIWDREERDRQDFLFKAHVGSASTSPTGDNANMHQISCAHARGGHAQMSKRSPPFSAVGGHGRPASEEETDDTYDIGLRWLIRNHKMIVAGFDPGCLAKEKGVQKGDILRAIDGVDVLALKQREDGSHEAEALLLGELGTSCTMSLLRPQAPDASGTVALSDFSAHLPRCLPAEED